MKTCVRFRHVMVGLKPLLLASIAFYDRRLQKCHADSMKAVKGIQKRSEQEILSEARDNHTTGFRLEYFNARDRLCTKWHLLRLHDLFTNEVQTWESA